MPKVKLSINNQHITNNIKALQRAYGVSCEELALAAGMSEPNLYLRFRRPGKFNIDELQGIARKLNVTAEDLQINGLKLETAIAKGA